MNGRCESDEDGDISPQASSQRQQLPTPGISPLQSPIGLFDLRADEELFPSLDERLEGKEHVLSGQEARSVERQSISPEPTRSDGKEMASQNTAGRDRKRSIGKLGSPTLGAAQQPEKALKLSPKQIEELRSPGYLPVRAASPIPEDLPPLSAPPNGLRSDGYEEAVESSQDTGDETRGRPLVNGTNRRASATRRGHGKFGLGLDTINGNIQPSAKVGRPELQLRTVSTPPFVRRKHSGTKPKPLEDPMGRQSKANRNAPPPLNLKAHGSANLKPSPLPDAASSPMTTLPVPPLSLPLFLQLELAADGPSPLYIHRSSAADRVYESSTVTFERLQNFLELPYRLEQALFFGAIACFDAWLYVFTILPLRFLTALRIFVEWWIHNAWKEVYDLVDFVYRGLGRLWHRRQAATGKEQSPATPSGDESSSRRLSNVNATPPKRPLDREPNGTIHPLPDLQKRRKKTIHRHRRTRSTPSILKASHKADLLKGLLMILTCSFLMFLDPSRMYHGIRGQAAIKLYVIYNVLEVGDRMLGALGQDIFECLFSHECLERDTYGRSKLMRPFWMFLLALIYTVIHASALFYQAITLNVAVNSYSNALLTLLMSNQFVEIKGSVFKKFEKENLFQMTCADIVERFQLWVMLLIIAMRNIVEVGGLNVSSSLSPPTPPSGPGINATGFPISGGSVLPNSFTIFPNWTGQVIGPFLVVLGSEMLVDWLKHAFITKFNNTKPKIYGRFYDVLAKDYYTHAFADQDLTKRLGLPTLPLACLFVRACIQTYHMFLAIYMPPPIPSSATAISVDSASASSTPATKAALAHIDEIFRRALGRSTFGAAGNSTETSMLYRLAHWTLDDVIAIATGLVVFLVIFVFLLAFKLLLGMGLLSLARSRYKSMKDRERMATDTHGKRVGGWGVVEVDDEKRRWIYRDDEAGLERLKEKEAKAAREREKGVSMEKLESVRRYDMVAKRIW